MIVYGSRAVYVDSETVMGMSCSNCGSNNTLMLTVLRKHFHVFWIPMFPIGKTGFSQCQNCKQVLEPKEMPESLRLRFDNLKLAVKGPIWQFSGLGVVALLMILGNFFSKANQEENQQRIAAPQVGDVYHYKVEAGEYSTLKVVQVVPDTVFVVPNQYTINRSSRLSRISKEENYLPQTTAIATTQLKRMFKEGEIIDVVR